MHFLFLSLSSQFCFPLCLMVKSKCFVNILRVIPFVCRHTSNGMVLTVYLALSFFLVRTSRSQQRGSRRTLSYLILSLFSSTFISLASFSLNGCLPPWSLLDNSFFLLITCLTYACLQTMVYMAVSSRDYTFGYVDVYHMLAIILNSSAL